MLEAMTSKKSKKPWSSSKKLEMREKIELAGGFVERTTVAPPKDLRTYVYSEATIHCFHNIRAFVSTSVITCDKRTVLFADKATVESNQ